MAGWPDRAAMTLDSPGTATRGVDTRKLLDQVEYLSQGVPVGAVYKTAGTSINSGSGGATFQNDPHLSFEVEPNEVIRIRLEASYTPGAGAFKQQFLIPSGAFYATSHSYGSATPAAAVADGSTTCLLSGGPAAGALVALWVYTTLFVGATGGTVNWQWAQNASNAANTTVSQGSVLEYLRMS